MNCVKMPKEPIQVVKLHLSRERVDNPVPFFPKMPKMYLELLENKDKIKPEMVNQEYIPDSTPAPNMGVTAPLSLRLDTLLQDKPNFELPDSDIEQDSDVEEDDVGDSDVSDEDDEDEDEDTDIELDDSVKSSHYSFKPTKPSFERFKTSPVESFHERPSFTRQRTEPDRIRNHFEETFQAPQQSKYEYREEPPNLADLNIKQNPVYPDAKYMNNNAEEDDMKRELLFKFELLKKSYKNVNIPEFNMFTDYETMKRSYESTVKNLSIDNSVESYKQYLIGGFMLVEFVLGNWFNLDMQGFTNQQLLAMNTYERLLIELGEKSYVDEESQWPVEARLMGLVIMNAGMFIVSKMIFKKTGSNLMNMINSMNINPAFSGGSSAQPKKRTMKRPDIDIDNFPEV